MILNNARLYLIGVLSIVFVLVGALFVVKRYIPLKMDTESATAERHYSSAEFGISFSYPPTFVLSEADAPGSDPRKHHIITLTNKGDILPPEDGGGVPIISFDMYQNNLDRQTTEEWIRNTSGSNYKMGLGILSSTSVSSLPALSYRWSGIYEGTTIVTARPNWVYSFTVNYYEMGDQIVQDFVAIKNSVQIGD